jgi:hypothetical protein
MLNKIKKQLLKTAATDKDIDNQSGHQKLLDKTPGIRKGNFYEPNLLLCQSVNKVGSRDQEESNFSEFVVVSSICRNKN